ncbi:serine kinase [Bacillus sp. AFS059628]|nr:serine kinase [Bacillus sp. AFS059628]
MHIVFIWIFSVLKLNIGIFVYKELRSEIYNEF